MQTDLDTDILLNQFAQGVTSSMAPPEWFALQPPEKQRSVLARLAALIGQAGACGRHVEEAIERAGVKATLTPAVLLRKAADQEPQGSASVRDALARVRQLPATEASNSFCLLVQLLAVADEERREREGGPCERHWWHRRLDDPAVVEAIKRGEPG